METTLSVLTVEARNLATREMETDPVPHAIAARCAARAGKPITKADIAAIVEAVPGITLIRREWTYGIAFEWWCNVETYDRAAERMIKNRHAPALLAAGVPDRGSNASSIVVSRDRAGVRRWPATVEEFKTHGSNVRWFAARTARNDARRASLESLASADRARARLAALADEIRILAADFAGELANVPPEVARAALAIVKHAAEQLTTLPEAE